MPKKNKALIFDLDGTLLNSAVNFHKIVNELKSEKGQKDSSFDEVRKFSSRGAYLVLKNCFKSESEEEINHLKGEFLKRYHSSMVEEINLYPDVDDLVKKMTEEKIPWGIMTNKSNIYTSPIMQKLGWDKLTSAIVCPEDVSEAKPSPEGVLKCLEILNADVKKSFYIGDHERDIITGKNAGLQTIACTYGYFESDPLTWQADFFINEPIELQEFLK